MRMRQVLIGFICFFGLSTFVVAQAPCAGYEKASQAYTEGKLDEALQGYKSCLDAAPGEARLNYLVGLVYENKGDFENAIKHWSRAVALDPFYQEFLRDRFDAKVPGITRGLIHDHFGQKFCFGFLFVSADKLSYRSLWGFPRLGTDDSFETPLGNIARVEVKGKERGKGWISNMPQRLELHFFFKQNIKGSEDNWNRDEMKFFFGQTQIIQTDLMSFAKKVLDYLKTKGVTIKEEP